MTTEAATPETPARAARPSGGWLHGAYSFLVSPKLALALLLVVLGCCVAGATFLRARANELVFSALWFNALLGLLAVSSAAAFFTRTWKRKLTLVQTGMILFHVSFAAMLGGIVYNRLFFFDGVLRLTEGETLPNGRRDSYDQIAQGRFFDFSRLRGETTLVKMHRNYEVDGENKRAAYEVAISDGDALVRRIIWVAQHLDFERVRYFCQKEGYSVLVVLSDREGRELYGAHVPLQSFKQTDGSFVYAAGTPEGPVAFAFPPPPEHPLSELALSFRPSTVAEREGEVTLEVSPLGPTGEPAAVRERRVLVGGELDAGELKVSPREVRYWVGMNVRYDPGMTLILASLTVGLAGMVLTFVGRVRQGVRHGGGRRIIAGAAPIPAGVRTESP